MSLEVHWVNQYAIPPDQPGGTRHVEMAAELIRRGVDCRIVASDLSLNGRSTSRRRRPWSLRGVREDVGGVPFTWLSAGRYGGADWQRALSMLVFAAGVLVHLLRVPRRHGQLVFIGSSPHLFGAFATCMAARVRRVGFVFEVRDLWPESYVGVRGSAGGLLVRVLQAMADHLYRRSDAVVVLAAPNREAVVARGADPSRVHVVPNGVDLSAPEVDAGAGVDLGRDGRFTFVYAGAHGPANGLDVVLRACRDLQDRGDGRVRVVLVGDGPAKAGLRTLAAELRLTNVELVDPVAKADVPVTLRSADAGLMVLADVELFRTGVSPNKLYDYLAAGLPVITNVGGVVADVVEAAHGGLVVPPGDPAALADAMARLGALPEAELAELRGGRRWVEERHDRRVLAGTLLDVLTEVASGQR